MTIDNYFFGLKKIAYVLTLAVPLNFNIANAQDKKPSKFEKQMFHALFGLYDYNLSQSLSTLDDLKKEYPGFKFKMKLAGLLGCGYQMSRLDWKVKNYGRSPEQKAQLKQTKKRINKNYKRYRK